MENSKTILKERNKKYEIKAEQIEDLFSEEIRKTGFFSYLKSEMAPPTRLAYLSDIRDFLVFLCDENLIEASSIVEIGEKELGEVKGLYVNIFLEALEEGRVRHIKTLDEEYDPEEGRNFVHNKKSSQSRRKASVIAFFDYMERYDIITQNVTGKVKKIKQEAKKNEDIKALAPDEVMNMLDIIKSGEGLSSKQKAAWEKTKKRDFLMILIFVTCGLRLFELRELNIDSYDEKDGSILVYRKGGKIRNIPFNSQLEKAYFDYIENERESLLNEDIEEKALFLSQQGKRMSERQIREMVKKYTGFVLEKEPKGYSPHKLRSTVATNLIAAGHSIYDVQNYLDHDHVLTTEKYAKHKEEEKRRIVKDFSWE